MKAKTLLVLLLFSTSLLVILSLFIFAEPLWEKRKEVKRLSMIQKISMKEHPKRKDIQVPLRTIGEAQKKINQLLLKNPIIFSNNSSSLEQNSLMDRNRSRNKVTLARIIDVLNYTNEEVVLSISTHTDNDGTSQENLILSQDRADKLKLNIGKRAKVKFISSIGYGEEIPLADSKKGLENRRVEMKLRRIQQ